MTDGLQKDVSGDGQPMQTGAVHIDCQHGCLEGVHVLTVRGPEGARRSTTHRASECQLERMSNPSPKLKEHGTSSE